MKKLAVVAKNGVAVVVSESNEVVGQFTSADSTTALLNVVKELLATIPTNDAEDLGEAVTVYLPKTIRGLASGAVRNYIREGKSSRDKEMQPETVALYKECMILAGQRNLTVDFKDSEYVAKSVPEVAKLVNNAWIKVKAMANNSAPAQAPAQPAVNPKIASKIKELEDQIVDAIMEDDEELEASLTAKLNKLKAMAGGAVAPKAETKTEEPKEEENKPEEMSYQDASKQFDAMMNA